MEWDDVNRRLIWVRRKVPMSGLFLLGFLGRGPRVTIPFGILITAVFALGIAVGTASAVELVNADYGWWSVLSEDTKTNVIDGATDAYINGWQRGSDAEGVRIDTAASNAASAGLITQSAADYIHATVYKKDGSGHYVSYQKTPVFGKTFGAYQALVDNFYARFSSSRKATIGDVLTCLVDDPVLKCDDIAKFAQ